MDFDDRAELLAADPDVYYLTDHYVGYNGVLVRLSHVNPDVLRDLLGIGLQVCDTQRRTPFASAEAPKARSKKMNKSMIPSDEQTGGMTQ